MSVYKKPGGGCPSFHPKVLQLVTTHASPNWTRSFARIPISFMHFPTVSVTHGGTPWQPRPNWSLHAQRGIPLPARLAARLCALQHPQSESPLCLASPSSRYPAVAGPSPNNLYPHFVTAGTLRTKALHISRGMPVAPTGDRWQEFVARSGYSLPTTHFLNQTNPAAPSKSGPTAAGTGTTPLAESPPANASASPFRAESCAARRPLPPAFAPGTSGPW